MKPQSETALHFIQTQPQIGAQAQILGFAGASLTIERLREMGFAEGLEIEFCGRAPFHGPVLFRLHGQVAGMVVALRKEEAECLLVKKA